MPSRHFSALLNGWARIAPTRSAPSAPAPALSRAEDAREQLSDAAPRTTAALAAPGVALAIRNSGGLIADRKAPFSARRASRLEAHARS